MAKTEQVLDQDVPTEFPADQLFVAVSESAAEYAGNDGGPIRGGRGLWAKGVVGQWTANFAPPIALRDPASGLIWKGYLEPVTRYSYGLNGAIVCNESQKFYAEPMSASDTPKPEPKPLKVSAPTEKAAKRAKNSPADLGASLKQQPTSPLARSASGRASDAAVG
jgi:hypothetical protein